MRGCIRPIIITALRGGFVFVIMTMLATGISAQVIITEIMFMPNPGEPEWLELLNWSEEPVNLDGWSFGDRLSTYPIPAIVLNAGSYAILCKDTATFPDTLCYGSILTEPGSWPALNNDLDTVRLIDNNDTLRCLIPYDASELGDCMGYGVSAEVTAKGETALVCSPVGRTPGCDNAYWIFEPGESNITAEPNPFDPTKGPTTIELSLPGSGITVAVYDRLGRKLVTISEPSNSKGYSFQWDGRDEGSALLPAGMYILFAEDSDGNSAKSVVAIKGSR